MRLGHESTLLGPLGFCMRVGTLRGAKGGLWPGQEEAESLPLGKKAKPVIYRGAVSQET